MEITAIYDRDSKRYHRYLIEADEDAGIVGTIYIRKDKDIPKEIIIKLKVKEIGRQGD